MNNSAAASSPPPGVSIVIPAYNYAKFLPCAVDSVLAQDYPVYEVVVVDDGSKDNTREVMSRYGPPVRYVYKENAGLSAARNTGIEQCRYDFICFLDADDCLMPGHLSECMAKLTSLPPEYAMVACDRHLIDVDGKRMPLTVHVPATPREMTLRDILMRSRFPPTGVVAKKEVFAQCGDFDTNLRSTEDRDMWIRIAAKRRIFHMGKEMVLMRKHGSNMSNNADRMRSNMHAVLLKSWRNQLVPKSHVCFWLQVASFWCYQTSLIYSGTGRRFRAYRDLFASVLLWPWFPRPDSLGLPPLFRARSSVRFALDALAGRPKP